MPKRVAPIVSNDDKYNRLINTAYPKPTGAGSWTHPAFTDAQQEAAEKAVEEYRDELKRKGSVIV
jgi:hypothetical protein